MLYSLREAGNAECSAQVYAYLIEKLQGKNTKIDRDTIMHWCNTQS